MFSQRLSVLIHILVKFVYGSIVVYLRGYAFGLVFHRFVFLSGSHGFKCCLIQTHWKMGRGGWFFKSCHYLYLWGGGGFGCFKWKRVCLAFLIYNSLMFQIFKNRKISRLEVGSNTPTPSYYSSQTLWLIWTIFPKRAFMLIIVWEVIGMRIRFCVGSRPIRQFWTRIDVTRYSLFIFFFTRFYGCTYVLWNP